MKLGAASIACADLDLRPTRHAARGGPRAVMGSKGVKVIVLDDTGTHMRTPRDPEKFGEANKSFVEGLRKHPITGEGPLAYGTNVLTNVLNEAGAYPTRNFKDGRLEGATKICGKTQVALETERGGLATHACQRGCVIRCTGVFFDRDGRYVSKQPEYETVWAHGGNSGIDDVDKIAMMDFLEDDIGLGTMETGVTIGVAMEAGLLKFGDADGAIDLVKQVGQGTPLGRIIGSGAAVTGGEKDYAMA